MAYDVIQVEDDGDYREAVQRFLRQNGVSCLGVETLEELISALSTNPAVKVFLLDGIFPAKSGDKPSYNAERAVAEIKHSVSDAAIAFLSTMTNAAAVAEQLKIDYPKKNPETLMSWVKEKLDRH